MASGEGRGYFVSRETGVHRGVRRGAGPRDGCRSQQSSKTESKKRPSKFESSKYGHETHGASVSVKTAWKPRGYSSDSFQLKPTHNDHYGHPRHHSLGNGSRMRTSEMKKEGARERKRSSSPISGKRQQNQRQSEGGLLKQFKSCEEQLTLAVQQWEERVTAFSHVETLGTQLWTLYQQLLEENMANAVREGLSLRVWRCFHYPTIEVLRKQQHKTGIFSPLSSSPCLLIFSILLLFLPFLLFLSNGCLLGNSLFCTQGTN